MPLSDGEYLVLTDDEWLILSDDDYIILAGVLLGVLSGDDYQEIAFAYGSARGNLLGSKDFLYDAVYTVVMTHQAQTETDLLSSFWDTYSINFDSYSSSESMLPAVRVINKHVVSKGGYESIDQ